MKKQLLILVLAVVSFCCATNPTYRYLNNTSPGAVPQTFFAATQLPEQCYPQYIAFSKDGRELYLATSDKDWRYKTILHSTFENSAWSKPDTAEFMKRGADGGEPFVYGNSVFFVSFRNSKATRQTDIYQFQKGNGAPSQVLHLPPGLNSSSNEWHPTLTNSGVMYFASERNNERFQADIYRSTYRDGVFTNPIKLSDSVNSAYNDGDPLISPDEKFLIFHSERPGGYGGHDLYISFRKKDGSWTAARNMGPAINSAELEFGPSLSPDGKYLFFTRRKAFQTEVQSEIYWVLLPPRL
ncbi:MAG TPA: hypothetical protein VGD40_13915 [Chryseosolibacter sp.]